MLKVKVMYFASYGEITGLKEEEIQMPGGSRVEDLIDE